MLSYLPIPHNIGEMKTKPTQYASRELNSAGLQADVILARAEVALDQKRKEKIATFCNVSPERVISAPDVDSIYDVPLNYEADGWATSCATCSASRSGPQIWPSGRRSSKRQRAVPKK